MGDTKKLIRVARGAEPASLVLKNISIVDVFSQKITTCDLALCDEMIAGVGTYSGHEEIDCTGQFVTPGLIDTHVHIESTFVSPTEYARAALAHGVTSAIFDPHEIANVAGVAGIEFMLEQASKTPLDLHLMIPSCVPATSFDSSGAVLDSTIIETLMPRALGLGEMMDYPALLAGDDEVLKKLNASPFVDGHAPFLSGNDLNAYVAAGVHTDHECSTEQEMRERIQRGMYVQIREGSYSKNLEALVPHITNGNLSRCLFCTDDRFISDLMNEGSIDNAIRKAVRLGLDPIKAVVIATLNAAQCYSLPKRGAIAPGNYADLVIVDNLTDFAISAVYKNGVVVARDGEACFELSDDLDIPASIFSTVRTAPITSETFALDEEDADLPAIQLGAHDLTTTAVYPAPSDAKTKVTVIERHGKSGAVASGYISNYHLVGGALASTVSHDSHNLIVCGDNDEDMAFAANTLGTEGGIALVSHGKVVAHLRLPIAGLMSEARGEIVARIHDEIEQGAHAMGVPKAIDPIMALEFISLPVIPEIRITAGGLFDVTTMKYLKEKK